MLVLVLLVLMVIGIENDNSDVAMRLQAYILYIQHKQ